MKFGSWMQILLPSIVTWQSTKILQIQHGGRPPYLKYFYSYISSIYCRINAKSEQNHVQTQVTLPEYQILKNRYGGWPPIENSFINFYQPRIIRFQLNFMRRRKLCFHVRSHMTKFQNFKIQMADGRHIENRFLAIFQPFVVWLTRHFVRKQNHTQDTAGHVTKIYRQLIFEPR